MSLKRWAPWDQAESEAVVDQGEATGGQVNTLLIGAHDRVALLGRMIRQASARTDACSGRFKLSSPQRVEHIPHEYDALTLPLSEALGNEALDASVHRRADLAAESV